MEAVEGAGERPQRRALLLVDLPHGAVAALRMPVQAGAPLALRLQPAVQLLQGREAKARTEDVVAGVAHLVLDLPLLPPRRRRARHRLHQVVRAHLLEAAVEPPLLAHQDRVHRRLHVVVEATSRHPAQRRERPRMSVEDHLLRLARIGPDVEPTAEAKPQVRHLHPHRLARDLHVLVAEVELVGVARRKAQRHERLDLAIAPPAARLHPLPCVAPHRIVRPSIPLPPEQVVDARQRQPLAPRPRDVLRQQRLQPLQMLAQLRPRLLTPFVDEPRLS